tara:strand:+ start:1534 stop:2553 length:1020 start_codon:yes stop_codon:yes gene_type:complete
MSKLYGAANVLTTATSAGSSPAEIEQAFADAGLDYEVKKAKNFYPLPNSTDDTSVWGESRNYSLIHGTTGREFTHGVTDSYQVMPNSHLLRLALQAAEQGAHLEKFHLFKGGRRLAVSMLLPESEMHVNNNGDKLFSRLVGIIGHDKQTPCGAFICNTRPWCDNTFRTISNNSINFRVKHLGNVEEKWTNMIEKLNIQEQLFEGRQELELYKAAAETPMSVEQFQKMIAQVYEQELKNRSVTETINGKEYTRPIELKELKYYQPLMQAFHSGLGIEDQPKIQGTAWAGWNALTQITTSSHGFTPENNIRRTERFMFSDGKNDLSLSIRDQMSKFLMVTA